MATFNFSRDKYQLDSNNGGGVAIIKHYANRGAFANTTAVTAAVTQQGTVNASLGGRKKFGVHCRGILCTKKSGTDPNTRIDRAFVPILNPVDFAALTTNTVVSGTGPLAGYTIFKKIPELVV